MILFALAAGDDGGGWLAVGANMLLVGVLALLGNLYVQFTQPPRPGGGSTPIRIRGVLLPFLTLKMVLDGLVYFLWLQWLDRWGLPAWGKVLVTSGLYTPLYYVLFFYGIEVLSFGPRAVLAPDYRRDLSRRVWSQLKPVWRVDFWYFLVADAVSFYGGPWLARSAGLSAFWHNELVFVIFSGFDFFWDVLLSRALRRGDGVLDEKQVYLEAREAANHLVTALRRRRRRRRS